jgi:hypothetical protein
MLITEATADAVDHVFGNLWERGQQELAVLGYPLDVARAIVNRQRETGAPTLALWIDDEPIVISGLMKTDNPKGMSTWFQATDAFAHFALPLTKEIRYQLEETARAYDLDYIEIVSPCVHPKTGRWFGALGFNLDVDRFIPLREGSDQRLYRFERKFDHVLPQG